MAKFSKRSALVSTSENDLGHHDVTFSWHKKNFSVKMKIKEGNVQNRKGI